MSKLAQPICPAKYARRHKVGCISLLGSAMLALEPVRECLAEEAVNVPGMFQRLRLVNTASSTCVHFKKICTILVATYHAAQGQMGRYSSPCRASFVLWHCHLGSEDMTVDLPSTSGKCPLAPQQLSNAKPFARMHVDAKATPSSVQCRASPDGRVVILLSIWQNLHTPEWKIAGFVDGAHEPSFEHSGLGLATVVFASSMHIMLTSISSTLMQVQMFSVRRFGTSPCHRRPTVSCSTRFTDSLPTAMQNSTTVKLSSISLNRTSATDWVVEARLLQTSDTAQHSVPADANSRLHSCIWKLVNQPAHTGWISKDKSCYTHTVEPTVIVLSNSDMTNGTWEASRRRRSCFLTLDVPRCRVNNSASTCSVLTVHEQPGEKHSQVFLPPCKAENFAFSQNTVSLCMPHEQNACVIHVDQSPYLRWGTETIFMQFTAPSRASSQYTAPRRVTARRLWLLFELAGSAAAKVAGSGAERTVGLHTTMTACHTLLDLTFLKTNAQILWT